jgi:hypothetical protein
MCDFSSYNYLKLLTTLRKRILITMLLLLWIDLILYLKIGQGFFMTMIGVIFAVDQISKLNEVLDLIVSFLHIIGSSPL